MMLKTKLLIFFILVYANFSLYADHIDEIIINDTIAQLAFDKFIESKIEPTLCNNCRISKTEACYSLSVPNATESSFSKKYYFLSGNIIDIKNFTPTPVFLDVNKNICDENHIRLGMRLNNVVDGEPCIAILLNEDKKSVFAACQIIPKPLEAKSLTGASFRLQVLDALPSNASNALVYVLVGKGFQPNEVIDFTCRSVHEVMNRLHTADKEGKLLIFMLPQVDGYKTGKALIKISRKNGEVLKVKYNW